MNPAGETTIPRLHPQLEAVRRERVASGARPQHELSVAEARAAEAATLPAATREPGIAESDRSIPGPGGPLRIRLYISERQAAPPPVLVFFFGGGWVIGSIEASAPVCRRLALATPCAVAAVDYRRAPEHPFPAAVEDGDAATRWVAAHARRAGTGLRAHRGRRHQRRREPHDRGRAPRSRSGRASAGLPAARLSADRCTGGDAVAAGERRSRLLHRRDHGVVLVALPCARE